MRSTRVAAVSMNGRLGEPARILDEIDGWCGRAVADGAGLVQFPELVTLDAALLARERAHPNYQLKTRRPELYGEFLRGEPSS
jgi:predicted amidohydrolase